MRLLLTILLSLILVHCSQEPGTEPIQVIEIPHEAVPSQQTEKTTIELEKDREYGTTDNIIVGTFSTFAIDKQNRVFIADQNQTQIHVFESDGTFITSLGQEGRGPGEFFGIRVGTFIKVHQDKLYVTDGNTRFPHRVHVFLLDDFSFSHTIDLVANNMQDYATNLDGYYATRIYPLNDGNFLVPYRRPEHTYREQISFIRYVVQNSDRTILDGPVIEQQDRINLIYLVEDTERPYNAIRTFPFFSKSLFAMSDDEKMYTARSEEFKINVRDIEGSILRTISHPFTNLPVTRGELIDLYEQKETSPMGEGVEESMIQEADNLPETWPALNNLLVDDEDRLWVSTIVEDFDVYEWWVLEETGEVIAKFEWPRDKPIREIQNGYAYTLETEEETGLQIVVRYEIEMD